MLQGHEWSLVPCSVLYLWFLPPCCVNHHVERGLTRRHTAQAITLQHGAQNPSSVTRSGPRNMLCQTCMRKPTALPSRGQLSTVCLPFRVTPPEVQVHLGALLGRRGPAATPRPVSPHMALQKARPFRTRVGSHPQGSRAGPAAPVLIPASQVCSQVRKCHLKVLILMQKPQGEITDASCLWGPLKDDVGVQ